MCALVGLLVPRRPLVAELSHDERALVWAPLIESGHIPLRTMLGTCSRDLYRPLRLRLLAWGATSCLSGPSPRLGHSTGE